MKVTVEGTVYNKEFKNTANGDLLILRIEQRTERQVQTEEFPIFDADLKNLVNSLSQGDQVQIDCDVVVNNGFLRKYVNDLVSKETGEKKRTA